MRFFCIFFVCLIAFKQDESSRIQINGLAQGTTYHIIYYANDSLVKKQEVDSILNSLDSSLSIYKTYSLINAFNNSDKGIKLDQHLYAVVKKSLDTYKQTRGIFDITVFPLVQAWGFAAKHPDSLPDSAKILELKKCVSSEYLQLKDHYLSKTKPCVQIDVNGIAQGYSVDIVANYLEHHNIHDYVVEIGGEIRVSGHKPSGEKMKIGIEAPGNDSDEDEMMEKVLLMDHGGITTSGSYRKFYESNGKKISHIINPFTGYSAQNELISVTVYAKDAFTADAYDNALMVMGLQKALQFVEKRKDMAAFFIYHKPDGTVADTAISRFYKMSE